MLTCSRQHIALQGHSQDQIDFSSPPTSNEGNFIAILRLLAQNNAVLREHVVSGARNAKYTSKTIQNEIIEVAADYIRSIYSDCINKCPHFSIMGDEVSSQGNEILSVCLCFLEIDHENFQKRQKSIKFCLISVSFKELQAGKLQRACWKYLPSTIST